MRLSLWVLLSLPLVSSWCEINATSQLATLREIYDTFGGNPSWQWFGPSDDPCSWTPSITCEAGAVTSIELITKDVKGSLPPSLVDLICLQKIDLGQNPGLVGPLPTAFAQWSSLHILNLAETNVENSWDVLQQMTNLRHLDLSSTQFDETPPPSVFSSLTKLNSLKLSDLNMTGTLPDEIGELWQLTELMIMNSRLTGEIPVTLGHLVALTRLDFSGTPFSGSIPSEMSGMISLNSINFFNMNLSGELPESLGSLKFLGYLDVSNNDFVGEIPESYCKPPLMSFVVSNNRFTALPNCSLNKFLQPSFIGQRNLFTEVPQLFFNTNFSQLDLSWNLITCEGFSIFGAAASTFTINLNHNPLGCHLDFLIELFLLKHFSTVLLSNCSLQHRFKNRTFVLPVYWTIIDFSLNPDLHSRFTLQISSAMTVMNLSGTAIDIGVSRESGGSLVVLDMSSSVAYSCIGPVYDLPHLKTIYRTNFSWGCGDPVYDDTSVNYFKQEEVFCPQRRSKYGAVVVTDGNFLEFRGCYCQPNNWWNGTACVACRNPDILKCDNHLQSPNHTIMGSFYPWYQGRVATTKEFPLAFFLPCDGVSDCTMSGPNFSCAVGREGFLCAKCSNNCALVGRQCVECRSFDVYVQPISLLLLSIIILCYLYFRDTPTSCLLSITVFAIQMLSALDRFSALEDRPGPAASSFLPPSWVDSSREVFNFRPWSLECLSPETFNFQSFIWMRLAFPLAFAAFWFLLGCMARGCSSCVTRASSYARAHAACCCFACLFRLITACKSMASCLKVSICCCIFSSPRVAVRSLGGGVRPEEEDEQALAEPMLSGQFRAHLAKQNANNNDKMWGVFFNVVLLAYTPLCQASISLLNCVHVPGRDKGYLSSAPYLDCDASDIKFLSIWCNLGIAAYVLGIPVLFGYLIFKRHDAKIKFLTRPLRSPALKFWPLLLMLRQVVVLCLLNWLPLHSGLIPALVFMVLIFSLLVHIRVQPYQTRLDNWMESLLSLLVVILFLLRILQGSRSASFDFAGDLSQLLRVLQIFLEILAIGLIAFAVIPNKCWRCCSKEEEEQNDHDNNQKNNNNNNSSHNNRAIPTSGRGRSMASDSKSLSAHSASLND